jgi:uncharacterized protein YciI
LPKYLILYKVNPGTQPADPKEALKQTEMNLAAADELHKAAVFKEQGAFNPGEGYIIAEFPSKEEAVKLAQRFWPEIITDTREVVSWEKTKEITLSILREKAERTK